MSMNNSAENPASAQKEESALKRVLKPIKGQIIVINLSHDWDNLDVRPIRRHCLYCAGCFW